MTFRVNDVSDGLNISLPSYENGPNGGTTLSNEDWHTVLLVKIFRELKTLNSLLHCPNFTRIPQTLKAIEEQTKKRKKKPVTKLRAVA